MSANIAELGYGDHLTIDLRRRENPASSRSEKRAMPKHSERRRTLKWRIFTRPFQGWAGMAPEDVESLARSAATRFGLLLFRNHSGTNAAKC
jgi:hypothetical protein